MQEPKRESERPVKVEVGQRWARRELQATVVSVVGDDVTYRYHKGMSGMSESDHDYMLGMRGFLGHFCTYLGGGPSGEARSTGEYCREVGPAGVICTLAPGHEGGHVAHGINDFIVARYPRKPAPLTPPALVFTGIDWGKNTPHGLTCGEKFAPPSKSHVFGKPDGEGIRLCLFCRGVTTLSQAADGECPGGVPLSALEAIRAKVKPEPWVPSVDDFDLLPDAE